ncbi:hypothetical protein AGABI1DRAFT_107134 [Agaricus bisporus var. burnettii JB137-S8]|uniref:Myb-like domain-containing protein n=1 Tax=Agaricus bisporus var. burnettii (strain JB137-S8 / ATCC MYA-4627 / FGSC 10392) TaxID=597362 RepID=K5XU80_AGABU|nr:uncharacterized protein AGABI1DRAFT_107134 [Agaricus bisporus var. burnettii JB137-S8]EKM78610.1 hypothetical protein AGABI1DRAFT_107134 [Agaricus bisporus var. burnettii JB137-S8]
MLQRMDNSQHPQHYQPLSHALNPPVNPQNQPTFTATLYPSKNPADPEEEEEEEGEDDDDEGMVEEQLSRAEPDVQSTTSPLQNQNNANDPRAPQENNSQAAQDAQEPERKRRPGRPRGSKNRRPRAGPSRQEGSFYYQGQLQSPSGPPHLSEVNPQNHQYYEFQWRVLNLCAEFYGAAEELVKATPPVVVAQCYHMGPGVKVDPLTMLTDAKRVCDTLLANPSQLVSQPPPQIFSTVPAFYPTSTAVSMSPSSTAAPSSSKPNSAPVINNPQSFVVPLTAQAAYPHTQYPIYTPGQYPTTPYYHQYYPGTYYPQPVPPSQPPQVATSSTITTTPTPALSVSANNATSSVGAWSDEETERLKKLADDSKAVGTSGDIEWDWVVHQWGNTRTRHQILIKATSLGLKESTGRALKRRRENEGDAAPQSPPVASSSTPAQAAPANAGQNSGALAPTPVAIPNTASPAHSQPTSTPAASPALQNQQRPASSKGLSSSNTSQTPQTTTPTSSLPWAMPTVAVNTSSSVVSSGSANQEHRASYYRPRPADNSQKSSPMVPHQPHPYMYQPQSNGGAMNTRENGK